jgi:hypothetical protein
MSQYIVVSGTPMVGFEFFGPFEDVESATDWAADHEIHDNYWISLLECKA